MKIHYINILLFALPINILLLSSQAHNKNKPCTTPSHTQNIPTTRLLCECELYVPANYDKDPQMKSVMENFDKQTQQRFEEYDERMKTTRQKCKDQCDKEIQKIILKDKLEKQMAEQLTTLDTKITTEDIPTCICEKSLADKVEKGCLRCGSVLGGAVMPGFGAIGGSTLYALNPLKPTAISNAIAAALELNADKISAASIKAGNAHGTKIVTYFLEKWGIKVFCPDLFKSIGTTTRYTNAEEIANSILGKFNANCMSLDTGFKASAGCNEININFGIFPIDGSRGPPANYIIPKMIKELVGEATQGAAEVAKQANESVTAAITKKQTALIEAGFNNSITSIYASIIAILIIVLIMVIIYLILRYQRKKKMKKKLQYIKLLEE
ncbi:PIR protein, putative [Plasmodium sp.]|nr:PIR protein, putative [Plasmodium sp.]SCM18802.1 PIR protein, putative [Plasmodium sp.]